MATRITPKEKAEKMISESQRSLESIFDTDFGIRSMSIRIALYCVEEIINALDEENDAKHLSWWLEVKSEIENIKK